VPRRYVWKKESCNGPNFDEMVDELRAYGRQLASVEESVDIRRQICP